jgi:hypothetical protein
MKMIKSLRAPFGLRVMYMGPTVKDAVMEMAQIIFSMRETAGLDRVPVSFISGALVKGVDYEVVEDV